MTTAEVLAALHAAGYHAEHVMPADYIDVWTDAVPRGWAKVQLWVWPAWQGSPLVSAWIGRHGHRVGLWANDVSCAVLVALPKVLGGHEPAEARENNNGAAGAAKET